MQKRIDALPVAVMKGLTAWDWPGNIRELENFIERAVILTRSDLLDVQLRREISFDLQDGHNAITYVVKGKITIQADGRTRQLTSDHALALHGRGRLRFLAVEPAHFLVLSGAEAREPVLAHDPFIMNKPSQVEAALARYQAGKMGHLSPLAES